LSRNYPYGTIARQSPKEDRMGRHRNQIEQIERQIGEVNHDIDLLFSDLSLHILTLESPVIIGDNHLPYQNLKQAKELLDDYERKIVLMQKLKEGVLDANGRIRRLKGLIKEKEEELNEVYGRLGVIAWEEASSGVLSSEIKRALPSIEERRILFNTVKAEQENKESKKRESHPLLKAPLQVNVLLSQWKINKLIRGNREFFTATGKVLADSDLTVALVSEKGPELEQRYGDLKGEIGVCQDEIASLKQHVAASQGSLEGIGVTGSVSRKLIELQTLKREQSQQVGRLAIAYGRFLWTQGEWRSLSNEAEKLYTQIERHEKVRGQLEKQIIELRLEEEIGDLIFLVDQDEERILHLRQTIEQYNRQIEEIQKAISLNREKIGILKRSLAESLSGEE